MLAFPPARIPPDAGIYGLYLGDRVIYVGKATGKSDLRKRIWQQAHKINSGKTRLSQLQCRFLLMAEEWIDYAEHHLIRHYQPAWNGSGFGSHIPGAGRPGIKGPPTWDQKYPHK